jgi:hypothetical protein
VPKAATKLRNTRSKARTHVLARLKLVENDLGADDLILFQKLGRKPKSVGKSGNNTFLGENVALTYSNFEAREDVLAALAAVKKLLTKNPKDHDLQASYLPTLDFLRSELNRLTNRDLNFSESAYAPDSTFTTAKDRLEGLLNDVKDATKGVELANSVLAAIQKLIGAFG